MLIHARCPLIAHCQRSVLYVNGRSVGRSILTLAIESSCDDSCVAIVETGSFGRTNYEPHRTEVHLDKRVTASAEYKGIHPVVALQSHHRSLAKLVGEATKWLQQHAREADLVSVTRGPGMRANLALGLELAKGLSLAWDVPLVGVHHMQAHLLTPRLLSSMTTTQSKPSFPFLSLLVSGGHTLLASSHSVTDHKIVATTCDIAIGNMLDRAARLILPDDSVSFAGPAFERFAFADTLVSIDYAPPVRRIPEPIRSRWGWALSPPLIADRSAHDRTSLAFSFTGLLSAAERIMLFYHDKQTGRPTKISRGGAIELQERRDLAYEVQRVAFEHLATRVLLYLDSSSAEALIGVRTLVVSGGVASNSFLRHVLRSVLDRHGYSHIDLAIPPVAMCTDNAAMIGWAGIEMFEHGWTSELSIESTKQWSLDANVRGGLMGIDGWRKH